MQTEDGRTWEVSKHGTVSKIEVHGGIDYTVFDRSCMGEYGKEIAVAAFLLTDLAPCKCRKAHCVNARRIIRERIAALHPSEL